MEPLKWDHGRSIKLITIVRQSIELGVPVIGDFPLTRAFSPPANMIRKTLNALGGFRANVAFTDSRELRAHHFRPFQLSREA